jgi:nucleotide-binding universal stress UspA family protein
VFKRILIPTDGSALSRKAATGGVAFAKAVGATVVLYDALQTTPYLSGDEIPLDASTPGTDKRARRRAERYLAPIVREAAAADVPCETYITGAASPAQGIIDAARTKKCDVIFIASHGRSGLRAVVFGSVTQKVLAHSKLPVVVYR